MRAIWSRRVSLVFTSICKNSRTIYSILHAKVMLNLPVWQDAPRSSLENYNALCSKLRNFEAAWQLNNNHILPMDVSSLCRRTQPRLPSPEFTLQPRPNTGPNSCCQWCDLQPHATWGGTLFSFSKDYNKWLLNCQFPLLLSSSRRILTLRKWRESHAPLQHAAPPQQSKPIKVSLA